LKALNVKRLVIAAPWSDATNVSAARFIEASGFEVLAHSAMGHVSNLEIGLLEEHSAYNAGAAIDRPDAQSVLLACGNWLTIGIVDRLEAALCKPVLTTNQVSLWSVLRLTGYQAPVFGWGRLLRDLMA